MPVRSRAFLIGLTGVVVVAVFGNPFGFDGSSASGAVIARRVFDRPDRLVRLGSWPRLAVLDSESAAASADGASRARRSWSLRPALARISRDPDIGTASPGCSGIGRILFTMTLLCTGVDSPLPRARGLTAPAVFRDCVALYERIDLGVLSDLLWRLDGFQQWAARRVLAVGGCVHCVGRVGRRDLLPCLGCGAAARRAPVVVVGRGSGVRACACPRRLLTADVVNVAWFSLGSDCGPRCSGRPSGRPTPRVRPRFGRRVRARSGRLRPRSSSRAGRGSGSDCSTFRTGCRRTSRWKCGLFRCGCPWLVPFSRRGRRGSDVGGAISAGDFRRFDPRSSSPNGDWTADA